MSDDSGRFELTRRRLLGGIAVTGVAASGAGAGTWAYFQDTESSSGNSVQAGTMDLTINNGGSLQWNVPGATPGGPEKETQDVHLHNVGSVDADHVEIEFENEEWEDADGDLSSNDSGPDSDTDPDSAAGMAAYVMVESMLYDPDESVSGDTMYLVSDGQPSSVSGRPDVQDANGNGYVDLADLAHPDNQEALDGFPAPEANDATVSKFQITVRLHESTTNDYQGDVVQTTVRFSLHQDSGQNL